MLKVPVNNCHFAPENRMEPSNTACLRDLNMYEKPDISGVKMKRHEKLGVYFAPDGIVSMGILPEAEPEKSEHVRVKDYVCWLYEFYRTIHVPQLQAHNTDNECGFHQRNLQWYNGTAAWKLLL